MKLRITKGRIACAVILAPVLYLLNLGPLVYCYERFGIPPMRLVNALYAPLYDSISDTYSGPLEGYVQWWESLP